MADIQIYYLSQPQNKKALDLLGINLDTVIGNGDISIEELRSLISSDRSFCRDEKSIDYRYFLSTLTTDIILYAEMEGRVVGALSFMFNSNKTERFINLEGICSPEKYSKLGIGQELIDTLIRIGRSFDINYIKLDCKGERLMNYYRSKFGFKIYKESKPNYDSDDDSDEEYEPHYYMSLDLSTTSGGKKLRRRFGKSKRNIKHKRNRRSRRKLRK